MADDENVAMEPTDDSNKRAKLVGFDSDDLSQGVDASVSPAGGGYAHALAGNLLPGIFDYSLHRSATGLCLPT